LRSTARQILEDESRHLIASPFLRLETLPKARNLGRIDEVAFYTYVFSLVDEWVSVDDHLIERAIEIGTDYKVRNIDTIHAASAELAGVDQFVTTERMGKPFYDVPSINAVHILLAANGFH
jgi:predicted nucleic acid-binding protein